MTWNETAATEGCAAPVQLSDGTAIIAGTDVSGNGTLWWTSDRVTLNVIANPTVQRLGVSPAVVIVDASDNLYVVNSTSAQAFIKGSGHTWTAGTMQSFSPTWSSGSGTRTPTLVAGYWTSTGGTASGGQLIIVTTDQAGVAGVIAVDAGAVLRSSAPAAIATPTPSTGIPLFPICAAQDGGLGSGKLFVIGQTSSTGLTVFYFTVSASTVSFGSYTVTLSVSASTNQMCCACYAPGACLAVLGQDIVELSPTAVIYTGTSGTDFTGALITACYVDSQVWVYSTTGVYNLEAIPVTPGNPPTLGSPVSEQTNSSSWVNSQTILSVASVQTSAGLVDYLANVASQAYGSYTLFSSAPTAATLLGPANGSYDDVAAGQTFSAVYNSSDGAPANAYAFRIKQAGGSYQYYNAGTGLLQGSIVWNTVSVLPGATLDVPFPSGLLSNGYTYNWSVAFQESYAGDQGPFATDYAFSAQPAPTLMVTGPTGTVSSAMPSIGWTATPGSGSSMTAYQVIVESGSYGTTPGSGTQVWDSGTVLGTIGSAQVGAVLANGSTYRAFVQVTETHGETSVWQSTTFTVAYDSPATPTLTVYPDPTLVDDSGNPQLVVLVQGHDNYLTATDASFEGSLGTWTAVSGCTIDSSTAHARDGSGAMEMVATGSGAMVAQTGLYPCQPSFDYAAISYFWPEIGSRDAQVNVSWYTSTGTLISTVGATPVAPASSAWTGSSETVTSPSNAAQYRIQAEAAAGSSGDKLLVDCAGLHPAPITDWSQGGFAGTTTATITRWDPDNPAGFPVRYGQDVTLGSAFQQAVVGDQECLINVLTGYTATVSAPGALVSAASTEATSTLICDYGWLVDPLDPDTYIPMRRLGEVAAVVVVNLAVPMSLTVTEPEEASAFMAFGRRNAVVQRSGTINSPQLVLNLVLFGYEERATLRAMIASMHTLMVRTDMGDGWYACLGLQAGGESSGGAAFPIVALRGPDRRTNPTFVASGPVQTTDTP